MSTASASPLSKEIEGAIIETALALDDTVARHAFLGHVFQDDPMELARMEGLLEASREAATFFVEARDRRTEVALDLLEEFDSTGTPPVVIEQGPAEGPGSRIDRYRLIGRIGEGGCGVVYEAEQEVPLRRRVALKVIRLGMDTEGVVARFEIERQALALMSHPNIARVLDAGATSNGRPYFVMELVNGEKLTSYCDARNLDVRGRLHLFLQVCHAIQHAHQKGIIHRDVKPSNILVTIHDGNAVPKVIDFGIAKAKGGKLTGQTMFTVSDQLLGTPAYMSPEQVDMGGIDVDTRSDVYSLGVLLYELLAGRTPFDGDLLAKAGFAEMRRILLEQEPATPSGMLRAVPEHELAEIAGHRHTEPPRLISLLDGDLDWIVIKALAKDRNRRYQTVNGLAMDVQRFLNNEPVTARRPGRFYLLGKFIRRNRVAFASAVAATLSLVAGLGMSTRLYLRERAALFEQARLSREAETGRAREARLRGQAQARANVSRVAVLLSEGNTEEADALLHENPLESIEPSREAADVFRSLGDWNSICKRWDQALECYVLLNQANRFDDPASILEGSDLLVSGPAFLEKGDRVAYHEFRTDAIKRYLPVKTSMQAEHMAKACLLMPADKAMLEQLRSTAEMCADGFNGKLGRSPFPAWEAFSVTLFRHREGDVLGVMEWGSKCLAHPSVKVACRSSVLSLQAMALHRQGDSRGARGLLEEAGRLNDLAEKNPSDPTLFVRPHWYDWSVARILFREAGSLLQNPP